MAATAAWRTAVRVAFSTLALACALGAAAERRVALLIGNNTYNASPLHNAVNDARDLGAALKALGFTTIVRENATRKDMIDALREFGTAIERADAAVFFYAGHALQFKDRNFLLPVDSDVQSEDDIPAFALEIQLVFDRMDRARTQQNIIILDACRDNPFSSTFKVSSPGLAQSSAPSGTLVAYATAPGAVAADGFGRNGMYTKHILQHIGTANLAVETLFKRVREGVEKETARRQTPWDSSSLKGEFRFNNGAAGSADAPATRAAASSASADVMLQIERDFWMTVRDSDRAEELQAYLTEFPNGKFVTLAKLRLQRLEKQPSKEAPPRSSSLPAGWRMIKAAFSAAPQAKDDLPPPTVNELFGPRHVAAMSLSPDGKRIAAIVSVGGRMQGVVIDRASGKPIPVTNVRSTNIASIRWLSDTRLLFETSTAFDSECNCRLGSILAVDVDGKNGRVISEGADMVNDQTRMVFRTLLFVRTFPGAPDDFIAQEIAGDMDGRVSYGALYRVNSRTGRKVAFDVTKPDSGENESWIFDEAGTPRVFSARRGNEMLIYYRSGANAAWQKIGQYRIGTDMWRPLAISRDGKSIYANSFRGRDKAAIVEVEPKPGGAEKMVASHPFVDVSELILEDGVALGIEYKADRRGVAWFDEELEQMQGIADSAFPRAVNELSWTRDRSLVLVKVSSDVSAGAFYLFDRGESTIKFLADVMPDLKSESLSRTRAARYRARDGLEIPAFVTLPRNASGPAPLVVVVHDGPWQLADDWRFNPTVQGLAAAGYAVLQVNFRGTFGYGSKHFRAGFKQWGRAMHDDLADGVAWAVEKGYADPSRVCITGEGYGGYAALMAVVRSPDVFRCAASIDGITDVAALVDSRWSPSVGIDATSRELIGDPDTELAQLRQISPLAQAARIYRPVLLAASQERARVPIYHSDRMRSALQSAGAKPVWLLMDDEGGRLANRRRIHQAIVRFVDESLGRKD